MEGRGREQVQQRGVQRALRAVAEQACQATSAAAVAHGHAMLRRMHNSRGVSHLFWGEEEEEEEREREKERERDKGVVKLSLKEIIGVMRDLSCFPIEKQIYLTILKSWSILLLFFIAIAQTFIF